ncbi:MAG: HD-GYP domain-containing protein [bacterium]|nr:HD-GYP domain-containing protein [bacterium]
MANMRKIPVEELKPGMVFDKALYIDSSNMLVGANIAVSENDIKKLMTWGVTAIETTGELLNADSYQNDAEDGTLTEIAPSSDSKDEKKIVEDYNNLLKKRKRLIDTHKQACMDVEEVHRAIKSDQEFTTEKLENSVKNIIKILHENSNIFLFLYGLAENKDYMVVHSVNVTFYSLIIGIALEYPDSKLMELGLGTLLIDAGMLKIPVYIIYKQSNLTDQEYNQVKAHPLYGYQVLRRLGQVQENTALISLQHHEQFDGKGYPRGLKGNAINEYARIAAIADSYEAQISNRSYREKVYFYHAMRNLLSSGVNRFDPVILRVFLSRMSVYPIGSIVELNNGTIGIIIGSMPEKPLRPIIKLIFNEDRKRIEDTVIINLLKESSLYIVKALDENDVSIDIFNVL